MKAQSFGDGWIDGLIVRVLPAGRCAINILRGSLNLGVFEMSVLTDRTLWQLGAGDSGRSYHKDLLAWRVALVGWGDYGEYHANPEMYGHGAMRAVERFAREARPGDVVVLKEGRRKAHAIGILGEYSWDQRYSNIRGWDLHHLRPTRWFAAERRFKGMPFAIGTFNRCWQDVVVRWVESRLADVDPNDLVAPTADEIIAPPDLEPWEHAPMAVAEIVARANAFWNYTHGTFGGRPSEDEVRNHLIVPFLLALGWPREQIAVEWKRMDIALYTTIARTPESCSVVVETKAMFSGLDNAVTQVERYREHAPNAKVVVTDGNQIELHPDPFHVGTEPVRGNLRMPTVATRKIVDALMYHALQARED